MKQLGKIVFLLTLVSSCAPVLSDLQSARHLEKGQLEVTPSLSYMNWSSNDEINQFHLGSQGGYGITDRLEVRLRYEYISAKLDFFGDGTLERTSAHAIGFGTKYSIIRDRLSVYLPIGFGLGDDIVTSDTWQMQPTLLFTHRFNQKIEITPSFKYVNTFSNTQDFIALNVGLGLSTNLDKWVIRPEYSYGEGTEIGGSFSTFSLGFSIRK